MEQYPVTTGWCPTLRTLEDWPKWKEYIETTAKGWDIWEYCDPATEKELYDDQPKEPKAKQVNPAARSIFDLDQEDFAKFAPLVSAYKQQKDTWNKKDQAHECLVDMIRKTVSLKQIARIDNYRYSANPRTMMRAIADYVAVFSKDSLETLREPWRELQTLWGSPEAQRSLDLWEELFKKCDAFGLVESDQEGAFFESLMGTRGEPEKFRSLFRQRWLRTPDYLDTGSEDELIAQDDSDSTFSF